jgi:hypothetical protein
VARMEHQIAGSGLRRVAVMLLFAGSVAVLAAPPSAARRAEPPTTVTTKAPQPTTTTRPPLYVPADTPDSPPTTVHVVFPGRPDRDGEPLPASPPFAPLPSPTPFSPPDVSDEPLPRPTQPGARPEVVEPVDRSEPAPPRRLPFGDILTRTGAETMPLARVGLAAVALGAGLLFMSRRRRKQVAA